MDKVDETQKYHGEARTEEVQDIIERMPTKFGRAVTLVALFLVAILFIFGFLVDYPDIVTGEITVTAPYSPIKLVANTTGNIQIMAFGPKDTVRKGGVIAYIMNPASITAVKKVKQLLGSFNVNSPYFIHKVRVFPDTLSMGELNGKYFAFLNAVKQLGNYQRKNINRQKEQRLNQYLGEQKALLEQNYNQEKYRQKKTALVGKALERDSILFSSGVIAEAEYENSKLQMLNAREAYQETLKAIGLNIQQINETESQLEQLDTQQMQEEKQMRLELISSYNDLYDNIKLWEHKYTFTSPIDGRVEFLKFWEDNQYVQAGEPVFSIVPQQDEMIGHVNLPASGAGKVVKGQKVIIKLDNYPYMEFGSINGTVKSVSLVTNTASSPNGTPVDHYLVNVQLPEKLTTNFGSELPFKYMLKGSADIVTKERKLIQRLFDNLKYMVDKK